MNDGVVTMTELPLLWSVLVLYVAAGVVAIIARVLDRHPQRTILALLVAASLLMTAAIAVRWVRIGHGPFSTLFEVLLSNLWSLSLFFVVVYWRIRSIRPMVAVVLPILFTMLAWLLVTDPTDSALPPTFDTIWLYIHIGFGKIFLGSVLVAVGLSGVVLLRQSGAQSMRFLRMPNDVSLVELAYRFMALGLIFDTLMLVAGAIWAQDAWGRYWGWDPLEISSLVSWLLLAVALHWRVTYKLSPRGASLLVILCFAISFVTLFGIPFLSEAAHKGTF